MQDFYQKLAGAHPAELYMTPFHLKNIFRNTRTTNYNCKS